MTAPHTAFIALGSNLGDRAAHLAAARSAIGGLPDTEITQATTAEETAPLGGLDQPTYMNQMLRVQTALLPLELLDHLQQIERALGRVRTGRWASRTIDLDIVAYEGVTLADVRLTLPHPGLATRDFWQRELAELRPT